MMEPASLDQLLARDPLAPTQIAIVNTLSSLMPGVTIVRHPGKVDLSELVANTIVKSPGVGIGWSRIRETFITDGATCFVVEWVAYIVSDAKAVANRRVEKEEIGLAIGSRILAILADPILSLWNRTGVMPVEDKPQAELKPFFTLKDAKQGTAYYVVTWSQIIADIGPSVFPQPEGHVDIDAGLIQFQDGAAISSIEPWAPVEEEDA
jgi:hypothetical protein